MIDMSEVASFLLDFLGESLFDVCDFFDIEYLRDDDEAVVVKFRFDILGRNEVGRRCWLDGHILQTAADARGEKVV